jgi:DNA-binding LacI/PurR family transcriptional regulator
MSGNKKATLVDVAHEAGVSIATVSNYLHDYPHMRASTKTRVQEAVDSLGYVANESARNLRSGRTGLIMLSIPDLKQIYFAELAEEVIKAAREQGYGVIVESTGNSRKREIASLKAMERKMTDGLIMSPVKMDADDLSLFEGDYPLVVLGERIFGAPAPHVVVENIDAAQAATDHLLHEGCLRIAVVGGSFGSTVSSRTLRTKGYVRALEKAGIPVEHRLVRETDEWTSQAGAQAVRDLFSEGMRPDAIFALNDLQALGVISQLREFGLRVPEDIRVVGFDNIDEASYTIPSLTSVDPMRSSIAEKSVSLIGKQIESGKRGAARVHPSGFNLVFRASSPQSAL